MYCIIKPLFKFCAFILLSFLSTFVIHFTLFHTENSPFQEPNQDNTNGVPHPYALSYPYIKYLAEIEQEIYQVLLSYRPEVIFNEKQKTILRYLKDYEASSLKGTRHLKNLNDSKEMAEAVVSHPLVAYRLIRRFAVEIDALLESDDDAGLKAKLEALKDGQHWPKQADLQVAMQGLLRSHYIYNFDLAEITSGKIGDMKTNVGLTTKQAFEIAQFAAEFNLYTLAWDWLRVTSWKMISLGERCSDISPENLKTLHVNVLLKHNQDLEQVDSVTKYFSFTKKVSRVEPPPKVRDAALDLIMKSDKLNWRDYQELEQAESNFYDHYSYIALCNGHSKQSEFEKSKLYCYYERWGNPYWNINPLKTEVLSLEPTLIQMYDFIGDTWIKQLIAKATPISRAPPLSDKTNTHRSAAYAWLNDSDIPEVPLSRRIELTTGLHVRGKDASTELQVASYIFGGHVDTHVDSLGEDANELGDRVTTLLIYLNDVPAGGYTVFPHLGTFAKPIKGSAILWFDALENGEIDYRMVHGACPPIFGYKWIATKWTHLNKNFLTRPCSLDPDE